MVVVFAPGAVLSNLGSSEILNRRENLSLFSLISNRNLAFPVVMSWRQTTVVSAVILSATGIRYFHVTLHTVDADNLKIWAILTNSKL